MKDSPPFTIGDRVHVLCGGPWERLRGHQLWVASCRRASTYPGGWAIGVTGGPGLTVPDTLVGSEFVRHADASRSPPDPLATCCPRARATIKALARVGLKQLALDVCERHGLAVGDVLTPSTRRRILAARDELHWELMMREYSSPAIAAMFGMNHTNVLDAVKRHERRLAQATAGRAA
jgi:hypothetical protein